MTTIHSVSTLARVVGRWAEAIEGADIGRARFYADQIRAISMLLAVDPAYRSLFVDHAAECDSSDAEKAAKCLHAFVSAATEAAIMRPGRE